MSKDFWRNSKLAVVGGGSWGTALAHLLSHNVSEVRVWVRDEPQARSWNSTRMNAEYHPELVLKENVKATHEVEKIFEDGGVDAIVWALPSKACRDQAKRFAPFLTGRELILHATKGVEPESLKRVSQILEEEMPCRRIGVISGPNLAKEVAEGKPAATVVASRFDEIQECGRAILTTPTFRVYTSNDLVGVEWAGTLKNILAIASGALDALGLGWNARSMLMTRGLAEMVSFGVAMGGTPQTFLGIAGVGDVLATCSSNLSRNYRVGYYMAKGDSLKDVLKKLGSVAEGVRTAQTVYAYAEARGISMPIAEAVCNVLNEKWSISDAVGELMTRPPSVDPWALNF